MKKLVLTTTMLLTASGSVFAAGCPPQVSSVLQANLGGSSWPGSLSLAANKARLRK